MGSTAFMQSQDTLSPVASGQKRSFPLFCSPASHLLTPRSCFRQQHAGLDPATLHSRRACRHPRPVIGWLRLPCPHLQLLLAVLLITCSTVCSTSGFPWTPSPSLLLLAFDERISVLMPVHLKQERVAQPRSIVFALSGHSRVVGGVHGGMRHPCSVFLACRNHLLVLTRP